MEVIPDDGEPNFLCPCPSIIIHNLHIFVEVGSYVSFFLNYKLCYRRIVAASKSENGLVNVRGNNYMTRTQFEEQYGPTVPKPDEINN